MAKALAYCTTELITAVKDFMIRDPGSLKFVHSKHLCHSLLFSECKSLHCRHRLPDWNSRVRHDVANFTRKKCFKTFAKTSCSLMKIIPANYSLKMKSNKSSIVEFPSSAMTFSMNDIQKKDIQ
jgi:hypothetical protein